MNRAIDNQSIFGTTLVRARHTPIRLAFATLVGSHHFWAAYVLGLPAVALLAASIHPIFISIAAGVPVVICLFLLWLSHEFIQPQLIINIKAGTLTLSKPYGNGTYSSIDVDDIESMSVVQIGHVALVNIHYHELELQKPEATAIDASDVTELISQLTQVGIRVTEGDSTASWARVIATLLVIFGSIISISQLFGSEAFVTGSVIVPAIVLVWVSMESFWKRHIRSTEQVI